MTTIKAPSGAFFVSDQALIGAKLALPGHGPHIGPDGEGGPSFTIRKIRMVRGQPRARQEA
ncbi:hypothetical protein FHS00_000872 [Limimaricola variabilis]|uniref:Uncharacterized protein n=2 Tax=Limimaricola variabilis TaxID=1492771 RepID=A0ABR6HL77_9RHOB|nr:hypothetical protein [Limimaricola variabilis]MBB3711310.1 hypothetical protein [Limimaricola variabilis]